MEQAGTRDPLGTPLQMVTDLLATNSDWKVVDVDPIRGQNPADAPVNYIFYLRSTRTHNFMNVLGEKVHYCFDCPVPVAANMVRNHPKATAEKIIEYAKEDLQQSKRCK